MSSVIFDMSTSLDGYVRAANPRPEEPMGERGMVKSCGWREAWLRGVPRQPVLGACGAGKS